MARAEAGRRNLSGAGSGAEACPAAVGRTKPEALRLMEAAVERSNMLCAYERVVKNAGAPGVDGLTVAEFKPWLQAHWPSIRQALLAGDYMPAAVRKVEIPKPQGGVRTLGIPTVLDRLIQQSLNQVLQPLFDPEFSSSSYGFRPGRNAHQAVKAAQGSVAEGKRWAVDLDLEKFFDRVNHDVLMARVARKVKDDRVLKLIRRYLEAGLMEGGITSMRTEGTPQGGPLSPLLSNILLDDLDRALERRGLSFCRYADDCNIYVGSKRAGVFLARYGHDQAQGSCCGRLLLPSCRSLLRGMVGMAFYRDEGRGGGVRVRGSHGLGADCSVESLSRPSARTNC
jgi:retron-type reverse transcriptase